MSDTWIIGLVVALAAAAVALLVWRSKRLRELRSRFRSYGEREWLEDILKHLSEAERSNAPATLHGLAGRLGVPAGKAADLISSLCRAGLIRADPDGSYRLTDEGRTRGLHLLRAHRLWERYLADRTGVRPEEWHGQAEIMEHRLDASTADALAARLGHPRYDPHGDPIPTSAGELPRTAGLPLTALDAGRIAVVTHVEDEPPEVFRLLVEAGFAPGVRVEVADRTSAGLTVRVEGRDAVLDPAHAANVTVEPLAPGTLPRMPARTLADAEPGERVQVIGISPTCQGPQRRRLLDLGLVPGTEVVAELVSTSGDPVAYRIRGALIALRRAQAAAVEIELEPDKPGAGATASSSGTTSSIGA